MQRLVVNNLGPITNCTISITDFVVLIGENAVGKSTISKAVFFFKSLKEDFLYYLTGAINKGDFTKIKNGFLTNIRYKFRNFFGSYVSSTNIRFYYSEESNCYIEGYVSEGKLYFRFDNITEEILFTTIVNFAKQISSIKHSQNDYDFLSKENSVYNNTFSVYISQLREKINAALHDNLEFLYLPAGRSSLSLYSNEIMRIAADKYRYDEKIDSIAYRFAKNVQEIKQYFTDDHIDFAEVGDSVVEVINELLKGKYIYNQKDDEDILLLDNGVRIKLSMASSGQQEVIWPLLMLMRIMTGKTSVFIVFEEPESNLSPSNQFNIVKFIALLKNKVPNSCIFLTTHSPYILSSLNNLIEAHNVAQYVDKRDVNNIISEDMWVDINQLSAYRVSNNNLENIVNQEEGLIKFDYIDNDITYRINEMFRKLLYLKVNSEEDND